MFGRRGAHTAAPAATSRSGTQAVVDRGRSSWDRYVAMAPGDLDAAVTYRAGRWPAHRSLSPQHPYAPDRSPGQELQTTGGTDPSVRDHYALLAVERRATLHEIERMYRQRVARIHPDKFAHDPTLYVQAQEQLKELNAAMQLLRDPLRRTAYDAVLISNDPTHTPLSRRLETSTPHYLT